MPKNKFEIGRYESASVKVMRSYDYCHFEVVLSLRETEKTFITADDVNSLRIEAARLADEAVRQYKKTQLAERAMSELEHIERLPEVVLSEEGIRQRDELRKAAGYQYEEDCEIPF